MKLSDTDLAEIQRRAASAAALQENEVFKTMISDIEQALLQQMKVIPPDSEHFKAVGRHLHALGDIEEFIEAHIQDGLSADAYFASKQPIDPTSLN